MVELNADIIGFLIGEPGDVVAGVIKEMCAKDPKSRTVEEEGRKLVQLTEYEYRVVNGAHYRNIRNEESRREYQRIKQAEYRKRRKSVKLDAQKSGARQAIADGLNEATGVQDNGQSLNYTRQADIEHRKKLGLPVVDENGTGRFG
jgi:hypothetical protein